MMDDEKISEVLSLFDPEDIPFIKAQKYIEYKEKEHVHVKRLGEMNENRKREMGRVPIQGD